MRTLVAALALLLAAAPAAVADSRVSARIDGASTLQRGAETTYTVTIRNAGSQTLGPGSPRVVVDLDSLPSSAIALGRPAVIGGAGRWSCAPSSCTLASGALLPPGATTAFAFPAQVLGSGTLDLDVRGNEVSFGEVRKSVRTSGTLLPVAYGLAVQGTASTRTGPIGFTLSEPARVTVTLERISTRWRLRKKVGGRIVRSQRCSDRRPRVRRTTLVRKGRTRCSAGFRDLFVHLGPRGLNVVDVPQLRTLVPGRRYRLRLSPRTRDNRQGRQARSVVFKTTR